MNGKVRKLLKKLESTTHKDKRLWNSLSHIQKANVRKYCEKFSELPGLTLQAVIKEL